MSSPSASIYSARQEKKGAEAAASAQIQMANQGAETQRMQFAENKELLQPYVGAGIEAMGNLGGYQQYGIPAAQNLEMYSNTGARALSGQQALMGLLGPEAEQQAMDSIANSEMMSALSQQGENSILQNASATGGLRGGNVQRALMEYRPQLMNDLINQRYSQLGGLAAQGGNVSQYLTNIGSGASENIARLGQGSATGQAALGSGSANQISNLMAESGAAQAGGLLAAARAKGKQQGAVGNAVADVFGAYFSGGASKGSGTTKGVTK